VLSISDVLKDVPATSLEYDAAIAKRDRTAAELESQRSKFGAAQAEIASVSAQMPAVTTLLARARARISKLTAATDRARTKARELAVARFVGGTSTALIPNPLRTVDETLDDSQRIRLLVEARNRLTAAQDSAEASLAAAREFTATLSGELDNMEATKARATSALEAAAAEITRLEPLLAATEHSIVLARSGAAVADSDLPLVALDAYWRASKAMEKLAPACQIPWWALAGIGRTESNHGRYGGAEVEPYGRVTIPIIGIALDGTRNTRRIPDTDKGLLDGDTVVDRAVGVMQFIPGTWKRWGSDGSGDKVSDPQNIYDAALSSARYLCSYGPGLNQPAVLAKAFFGYNHSQSYVDTVAARANAYALLPVPLAVPVA
jgi:membrane-bound lytic murein transglycosylase B